MLEFARVDALTFEQYFQFVVCASPRARNVRLYVRTYLPMRKRLLLRLVLPGDVPHMSLKCIKSLHPEDTQTNARRHFVAFLASGRRHYPKRVRRSVRVRGPCDHRFAAHQTENRGCAA